MTDSDESPAPTDGPLAPLPGSLQRRGGQSPLLYTDLDAPQPADPRPPSSARWLAFGSILLGGLLGGLIGYGTADLMVSSSLVVTLGGLGGAIAGAIGVGVVAMLTLRAMNEWRSVSYPESETRASSGLVVREPSDTDPATEASTEGLGGNGTSDDAGGEQGSTHG